MKTLGVLVITGMIGAATATDVINVYPYNQRAAQLTMLSVRDVIHDTNRRIKKLAFVKLNSLHTAPFEVGYLTQVLQEKYRFMVDRYNLTMAKMTELYTMEIIILLEDVERHFWEIEHIANMQHEIERKYKINSSIDEPFAETSSTTTVPTRRTVSRVTRSRNPRAKIRWHRLQDFYDRLTTTKKRSTRDWWSIEYGWEIDGGF